jgi:hypothetical protein
VTLDIGRTLGLVDAEAGEIGDEELGAKRTELFALVEDPELRAADQFAPITGFFAVGTVVAVRKLLGPEVVMCGPGSA